MLGRVAARKLDRSQQFALLAAREAWAAAGSPDVEPERLAVVLASGIGGVTTLLDAADTLATKGARAVGPHTVPMLMPNGPAAVVGLELTARGGVHAPVSACASGAESIAVALDLLRRDRADVVVCGGTEAAIHPLPLAGFAAMRALSLRNDEPEARVPSVRQGPRRLRPRRGRRRPGAGARRLRPPLAARTSSPRWRGRR